MIMPTNMALSFMTFSPVAMSYSTGGNWDRNVPGAAF